MLAVLAPVIVFGIVIFIHELGHFVAAKLTGVYAPRFSIGFGPALFRHRHGETEYVLAMLPLGGYVRMASRHDAETAFMEGGEETDGLKPGDKGFDPEAMMPFGPKAVPEHRWFESKSLAARLFIMIAGVTMNVLLAFVVFTALNLHYGEPVIATRVVGAVRAGPASSSLSQIQPGDTIVAVNGVVVRNWNDILERISTAPAGTVAIRTQRGEIGIPVGTPGAPTAPQLIATLDFYTPPVIGELLPDSPADRGGLRGGDSIVTIGGTAVHSWSDLQRTVSASPGAPLPFEIRRAGTRLTLRLTPVATPEKDPLTGVSRSVGKIGATPADYTSREPLSLVAGVTGGARQTVRAATQIVGVVRGLITREVSVRQLGGPIAITRASVSAAKSGLESLFVLIALLSVNVAVLNLLPIPILDGGQILINVAEAVKGTPFTARTKDYILRVGLAAILMIFAMSTFNDLKGLVGRLFG